MIRTVLVWGLLGYLSTGLLTLTSLLIRAYVQRISINWRQERNTILVVIFVWPYAWWKQYRNTRADREWRRQQEKQQEAQRLEFQKRDEAVPREEFRTPAKIIQIHRPPRKVRRVVERRQRRLA